VIGGDVDKTPEKLRELAAWYREFAEKAANPMIWESRLRMAEDLETEANRLESTNGGLVYRLR
jgi:hypothetical protein